MANRDFNRRVVRQRPNAPFRISDRFPDCVLYYCPVRDGLAVALEDRYANYWSAPEWKQGGSYVYTYRKGDVLWQEPLEGNPGDIYREITSELMRQLNGFENRDDVMRDRLAATLVDPMRGHAALNTLCAIFDRGIEDIEYRAFRAMWVEHFERVHPRPEGAKYSSHEITVRVARARHGNVCRRKQRLLRIKASATLPEELLEDALTREGRVG